MSRLRSEADVLKEEVASLHVQLESEREGTREVLGAYARDNQLALEEFNTLRVCLLQWNCLCQAVIRVFPFFRRRRRSFSQRSLPWWLRPTWP